MIHRISAPPLKIEAVLAVVDEFGEASLGLIAWELCLEEHQVAPAWDLAFEQQLLARGRYDLAHEEQFVRLTELGYQRLRPLDELLA